MTDSRPAQAGRLFSCLRHNGMGRYFRLTASYKFK
jgi:hypothetical protein